MIEGLYEAQAGTSCISCRMMILRADEQRLLPKLVEGVTGEIGLEDKARRHGAGGEHRERDQHDDWRFMRRVAVIVVRVIVVAVSRVRVRRDHALRRDRRACQRRS